MRSIFITLVCFLCIGNLISQNTEQAIDKGPVMKYHKVKFEGDKNLAHQLLLLGITIDHADGSDGNIVTEISEEEVNVLKKNNIKHTILIEDMAKFYEERILADYKNKMAQPPGICNAPNVNKPQWFHLGSMGGYFRLSEMEAILDSMQLLYPNLITLKAPISTTKTIQNRDIWYVKISDNPTVNENEPHVFYNALHHAREAASLSQLIFYMYYMLENYNTNPDIKFLVDNTEMYFVPCVNPDGYFYNQSIQPNGGGMWRKNRRNNGSTFGVDLNRNYGYFWGYDNIGSSPSGSSDTYRGTAGFSEPETQNMRHFCNTHSFVTVLNAHTYGNLLIYPWGYLPSLYTPDSATFVNWSVHLTEKTRFLYGTGDQTVNYVVNGDSDDWMYGEQSSKPKILAMTPEAGASADGFWPVSSRIIDICKTTLDQNIKLAKLVTNYAVVRDEQDWFISGPGYIKYNIQRLGMQNGNFTVSILPVGYGIGTTGSPKVYTAATMTLNQSINDSISFTLSGFINQAQYVKYAIAINNGIYTHYDTLTKIFGTPVTVLNEPGTTTTNWTTNGWANSTTKFKSPPASITDSPAGDYGPNSNMNCALITPLNLSSATYAHLQYYTRFSIEKNYDFVQIMGSTNGGGSWFSICAPHETSPASFGGTDPLYDGFQDGWVKEEIDLSNYVGQNLLLSFNLTTDAGAEMDGFYFDDLLVRKITATSTDVKQIHVDGELIMYPNPSNGELKVKNTSGAEYDIRIFNNMGQEVVNAIHVSSSDSEKIIDLSKNAAGVYFAHINKNGETFIKKIVLTN
ncbi:MAG: immune inhibitor A [Sphingobacteriaceae bacterium]|nr:immune inhibitor A [Sphingobacteriaceae bacterium]